jgi:hypothetical protein
MRITYSWHAIACALNSSLASPTIHHAPQQELTNVLAAGMLCDELVLMLSNRVRTLKQIVPDGQLVAVIEP